MDAERLAQRGGGTGQPQGPLRSIAARGEVGEALDRQGDADRISQLLPDAEACPQVIVSVRGEQEIVACINCGRMLYVTPDMEA